MRRRYTSVRKNKGQLESKMEPKHTTPRADFEWTDEAKETVRRLWGAGWKMDAIAAELECSRGAIAGLISRMGLQKSPKPRGPTKPKTHPNMQTIHAKKTRMQDQPPAVPVERHIPRKYLAPEATRDPSLPWNTPRAFLYPEAFICVHFLPRSKREKTPGSPIALIA